MGEKFILGPVRVPKAYEKLAAMIRDRIMAGELRPGDRLPPEARLADEAAVSRSTVREALRMLQEAGFVERSSPKIMVVSPDNKEPEHHELLRALRRRNVTFHHLYEALMVIEPRLAQLAASRGDKDDVNELEAILEQQNANLTDFIDYCSLDESFHLMIARMGGNPAMTTARAPMSQLLLPTLQRFIDSETMTKASTRYHERIFEAIREHDDDSAALMARRHVDDFRAAWEAAGLNFHLQIGELTKDDAAGPGPGVGIGEALGLEGLGVGSS